MECLVIEVSVARHVLSIKKYFVFAIVSLQRNNDYTLYNLRMSILSSCSITCALPVF